MIQSFNIFLIIGLLTCCNANHKNINSDINEIVSLIVEYEISNYPVRSIENGMLKPFDIKLFLKNCGDDKFLVAIQPRFCTIQKNIGLRKYRKDYLNLFNNLRSNENEAFLDIYSINYFHSDVRIIEQTSAHMEKIKIRKEYLDFHLLISFSIIVFNKERDKAILAIASSIGSLHGAYNLCFLHKNNGKWEIKGFQNCTIS